VTDTRCFTRLMCSQLLLRNFSETAVNFIFSHDRTTSCMCSWTKEERHCCSTLAVLLRDVYPPSLAECHKKRLNQASFVLLCFVLFAFSGLSLVFVMSVFDLSSVPYFQSCININGTPLRICSLAHQRCQVSYDVYR